MLRGPPRASAPTVIDYSNYIMSTAARKTNVRFGRTFVLTFIVSYCLLEFLDVCEEAVDEGLGLLDGLLARAVADGDGAGLGFFIADDDHIGHLLALMLADLIIDLLVAKVGLDADARGIELLGDLLRIAGDAVGSIRSPQSNEDSSLYYAVPVSQFIPFPLLPWYPCVYSLCMKIFLWETFLITLFYR